jgi:S-adenosylmethionine synthetase
MYLFTNEVVSPGHPEKPYCKLVMPLVRQNQHRSRSIPWAHILKALMMINCLSLWRLSSLYHQDGLSKNFGLDKPSTETYLYADVAACGQVGQSDYPWEKLDSFIIFESLQD